MWLAIVAFGIVNGPERGVWRAPSDHFTTNPVARAMAMHPDHTTRVTYAELPRLPGYRFGDDGSIWSRWNSNGKPDREWRRLRSYVSGGSGYPHLTLCVGGVHQNHLVHRLILEAFVGPCPDGMVACHNDGDTTNNTIENLRWDTCSANQSDKQRHGTMPRGSGHGMAKLREADIPVIRSLERDGWTKTRIAKRFGVDRGTIRFVLEGKTWAHVS